MEKSSQGIVESLLSLPIFEAEWVLWLLIILSVLSVAVILERIFFYKKHSINLDEVRSKLDDLLGKGDMAGAVALLDSHDSLETNVALYGLREHHRGAESVEELLIGAEAHQQDRYTSRLSFLATVGSNAPFIGLFGTVLGIIRAFSELGFDLTSASSNLMGSISEALVATGVGLFVAIPAVIAYNWLGRIVERRTAQSSLLSKTVLSHLKAHKRKA